MQSDGSSNRRKITFRKDSKAKSCLLFRRNAGSSASRSTFLRSASHRKAMIRFSSDLCWTSFTACLAAKVHPPRRSAPPLQGWDSDQELLSTHRNRQVVPLHGLNSAIPLRTLTWSSASPAISAGLASQCCWLFRFCPVPGHSLRSMFCCNRSPTPALRATPPRMGFKSRAV
jgi:hypothetical protein